MATTKKSCSRSLFLLFVPFSVSVGRVGGGGAAAAAVLNFTWQREEEGVEKGFCFETLRVLLFWSREKGFLKIEIRVLPPPPPPRPPSSPPSIPFAAVSLSSLGECTFRSPPPPFSIEIPWLVLQPSRKEGGNLGGVAFEDVSEFPLFARKEVLERERERTQNEIEAILSILLIPSKSAGLEGRGKKKGESSICHLGLSGISNPFFAAEE